MAGGLKERLARGVAANGFGVIVTSLIQLVGVKIFLSVLGKTGFDDWVVLGTVPSQLALSDLGFGTASAAEMTQRVARGDHAGARRVFQSCWLLVTIMSLVGAAAAAAFILLTPWPVWMKIESISDGWARGLALLLLLVMVAGQQLSLVAAAFKSDGGYAWITTRENWMRLAQWVAGLGLLMVFRRLDAFVYGFVGAYVISVALFTFALRKRVPWAQWGFRDASFDEIKPLIKPALSFMAFPFAYSLNINGFIYVVNYLGSDGVLSMWSTLRTLARFVIQVSHTLMGPAFVEIASAIGKSDWNSARKVHNALFQAAILFAASTALGIAALAPFVYPIYTDFKVAYHPEIMAVMLAAGVFSAMWNVPFTAVSSVNRHTKLTILYMALNAAGILAAGLVFGWGGLLGVAAVLVLIEAAMLPFCLTASLHLVRSNAQELVAALKENPLRVLKKAA